LAEASDNREHVSAVNRLNDRLAAFRTGEERLFLDVDEELQGLRWLASEADSSRLARALARYHNRRMRMVPRLLASLAV